VPWVLLIATQAVAARAVASDDTPAEPAPVTAAPPSVSPPATTSGTAPDTLRDAERRYARALQLYDEGAFDAALLELQRVYELAPSFRLLYNLGIVSLKLHDAAGAMGFFERYLHDGGDAVPADTRADVTQKLRELSLSVATVSVVVNVPGATILVDDRAVGTAPLPAPLRLNAGLRRVTARAPSRPADSRVLELAGGDRTQLELWLAPANEPAPATAPSSGTPSTTTPSAALPAGAPITEPPRPFPWLAWGGTLALAGAATWAGLEARSAQHDYDDKLKQVPVTRRDLDHADAVATRYSVTADVLAVSALALGGYALYLTLTREPGREAPASASLGRESARSSTSPSTAAQLEVWPGGARVRGVF
jgi:hypothetical protein